MKKKIIITSICILIIAIIVLVIVKNQKINDDKYYGSLTSNEFDVNDSEVINKVKEEINATGDTEIYQVYEEYDGRRILQIKPEIQYNVALAGILKEDIPEESEIEELVKKAPTKSGVWVSTNSRESFIKLVSEGFSINDEGYLIANGENYSGVYEKVKEAIDSDKLYIIDCMGRSYMRDEMTGEILEYPFEKMDPSQAVDRYENGNKVILELTTNSSGVLTSEEILTDLLLNLEN